jgi:thiol:disulfide interchange protein
LEMAGAAQKTAESTTPSNASKPTAAAEIKRPVLPWRQYNLAAVEESKKAGSIVMVDFTADWNIASGWNHRMAIDTARTLEVVNKYDIVPFLADWTKPSEEIKSALQSLGRDSIPVLAIYPAGQPDHPIVLQGMFTQQDVIDALEKAGAMPKGDAAKSAAAAKVGHAESAAKLAVQ